MGFSKMETGGLPLKSVYQAAGNLEQIEILHACKQGKSLTVIVPVFNEGDFRLMSRWSVEAVKQMTEYNRFMKGMFGWIGYPTKEILYERDARYAGKSKWNYWKLWNFAVDGMTSYSIAPLKISTCLGLGTSILSFFYGIFVVIRTLLYGDPVPGFPSLFVVILFFGGLQLLAIGIAGEYLGRIFLETKSRPLYLVKDLYKNRSTKTDMITKISKRNIV